MTIKYVILNARGTKIQIPKNVLTQSKVIQSILKVEDDKKTNEKVTANDSIEYYLNYKPEDVHNLVDFLYGNHYSYTIELHRLLKDLMIESHKKPYDVMNMKPYKNTIINYKNCLTIEKEIYLGKAEYSLLVQFFTTTSKGTLLIKNINDFDVYYKNLNKNHSLQMKNIRSYMLSNKYKNDYTYLIGNKKMDISPIVDKFLESLLEDIIQDAIYIPHNAKYPQNVTIQCPIL